MANKKQQKPGQVNTEGGAYIGGGVNTGGGDFVGRDKNTSVSVGGNLSGNMIIGDGNTINSGSTANIQNVFAPVYTAIQQAAIPAQEKEDLTAEVKEIETAIIEDKVDESWLSRRLRSLIKMAPEIGEVALAALAGPGAAVGAIVKKVAEKVKAEG
ncbi:MAG: hypothetical protein RBS68_02425 [Anaerolineales bacterium]|jgi:hypothetical protein|nr:hypothetical protein [Anaerolineales bacterium]